MASPSTQSRTTPDGIYLHEGYQSLIAFGLDDGLNLWEIDVGLPGIDLGDMIDITTQHNTRYRTKAFQSLADITEFTFTAAYDPVIWDELLTTAVAGGNGVLGLNSDVTRIFPDGSTIDFWGGIRMWAPEDHVIGTFPTATVTVGITNYDPANNVEAGPALTSVSGT